MAINDPRDIPGLILWYSAEAETGYTDGQTMTGTWTDLSGNGNHATAGNGDSGGSLNPKWQATTGATGGPALYCRASRFSIPSSVVSGLTSAEIFLSSKRDRSVLGTGRLWDLGSNVAFGYYGYNVSGGNENSVQDEFGSTTTHGFFPTGVELAQWHRYSASTGPGSWRASMDGVQVRNDTANTVAWQTTPTYILRAFEGWVGAIILYGRQLTTTERADLDAWLAANPSGGTTAAAPTPTLDLIGSAPTVTGSFDVAADVAPVDLAFAGTAPAVTGALSLTGEIPPRNVSLSGTAPSVSGSFVAEVVGAVTTNLVGTVPGVFGTFDASYAPPGPTVVETSTQYANDGYGYDGTAAVYFEPPIAEPPAHIRRVKVQQVHQSMSAPNLVNGVPR